MLPAQGAVLADQRKNLALHGDDIFRHVDERPSERVRHEATPAGGRTVSTRGRRLDYCGRRANSAKPVLLGKQTRKRSEREAALTIVTGRGAEVGRYAPPYT